MWRKSFDIILITHDLYFLCPFLSIFLTVIAAVCKANCSNSTHYLLSNFTPPFVFPTITITNMQNRCWQTFYEVPEIKHFRLVGLKAIWSLVELCKLYHCNTKQLRTICKQRSRVVFQ